MPLDPALKELQIKVRTVGRTKKELESYIKDEGTQRAKIEKMKAERKDEEDEALIKKQIEVLNDTLTVLPDTRTRLTRYAMELKDFLDANHKDIAIAGSGEAPTNDVSEVQTLVLEGRQMLRDVDKLMGTTNSEEPEEADVGGTGGAGDVGDF
eukprot:TRINITY_DN619_c0_g1_i1.p1 TRINITY_DN619_c0_g1~~TRINITY_DN619_c0_g1_i1.p1  ORF type:complete len:153 (+),score=40.09 TRINITY_DN619_c0_g1_i1:79-537(+)